MDNLINVLKPEEITKLKLRSIYEKHGFKMYRMGRFEEYRFYLENKNFLLSDSVITFTDLDGRLLALKPDVTLSIAKQAECGDQKVYYTENVYRPDRNKRRFKEIEQTGLEHIGKIDDRAVSDVVSLAAKSLRVVSADSLLEIGHCGFIGGLVKAIGVDKSLADRFIRLISQKNVSELKTLISNRGIANVVSEVIEKLPSLCGSFEQVLENARLLCLNSDMEIAVSELETLYDNLKSQTDVCALRLDLSLSGEEEYYNGVIFCGYVKDLPGRVLTGGRYDRLMEKLGKKCGAIGFALYFDELEQLYHRVREE